MEIIVIITDGSEEMPALFGKHDRVVCKATDGAAIDMVPNAEPFDVQSDAALLNQVVLHSKHNEMLLLHQSMTGLWDADGTQTLQEDEHWDRAIQLGLQLLQAYNTGCGGFGYRKLGNIHNVFPVSTVQPPSTHALLVNKEKFIGFVDLPYHYAVMDFFLRNVHDFGAVPRNNLTHTSLHPFGQHDLPAFENFESVWGEYLRTTVHKDGAIYQFKNHAYGV